MTGFCFQKEIQLILWLKHLLLSIDVIQVQFLILLQALMMLTSTQVALVPLSSITEVLLLAFLLFGE